MVVGLRFLLAVSRGPLQLLEATKPSGSRPLPPFSEPQRQTRDCLQWTLTTLKYSLHSSGPTRSSRTRHHLRVSGSAPFIPSAPLTLLCHGTCFQVPGVRTWTSLRVIILPTTPHPLARTLVITSTPDSKPIHECCLPCLKPEERTCAHVLSLVLTLSSRRMNRTAAHPSVLSHSSSMAFRSLHASHPSSHTAPLLVSSPVWVSLHHTSPTRHTLPPTPHPRISASQRTGSPSISMTSSRRARPSSDAGSCASANSPGWWPSTQTVSLSLTLVA